jgi:hypothetical protein
MISSVHLSPKMSRVVLIGHVDLLVIFFILKEYTNYLQKTSRCFILLAIRKYVAGRTHGDKAGYSEKSACASENGYVRRRQTPIFKSGLKAPLSINPEHTPGFRPGSRRVDCQKEEL